VECADVVEAERTLRGRDVPVIARVQDGRLIIDLRTVFGAEEDTLVSALQDLA
jgi:seryl-tRNA(Sec) selenium transferase